MLADLEEQYQPFDSDNGMSSAYLSGYLLTRYDFHQHMISQHRERLLYHVGEEGILQRIKAHEKMMTLSTFTYGLTPDKNHLFTYITHQFLHGDIFHLLGNLLFLVVCGFAVEAAVGHLMFVLLYVLAGVAGGVLHVWFNSHSTVPLVGASGAISGVMAMYLMLFRWKKIEFFYWFFIFVGYFRAPALMILPFYIGKEFYYFYTDTSSNVAFMAHVGGFVAGTVAMIFYSFWLESN